MLFLVKATFNCNGACAYCASSVPVDDPRSGMRLDERLLRLLYQRIAEHAGSTGCGGVRILWHGGEPLLAGPDYFRRVARFNEEYLGAAGIHVATLMQSNLTLATDEHVAVLKDLLDGHQLSTSFDPVADVRRLRNAGSYRERWVDGIERAHLAGIRLGVVYVVHSGSLGRAREIYLFFRNMAVFEGVRFNPLYRSGMARQPGAADLAITSEQWGRFLIELWDAREEDGRTMRVEPLDQWEQAASGAEHRASCEALGSCASSIFGVAPDGTIFPCGRCMDSNLLPLGNIETDSFESAGRSRGCRVLRERRAILAEGECAGCQWWDLCGGGCPSEAFLHGGSLTGRTCWCEGRKLFFNERLAAAAAVMQDRRERSVP